MNLHASPDSHELPPEERTQVVSLVRSAPASVSRADWVHYLVVVSGIEPGRRLHLSTAPLRVGRRPPCEIVFADTQVSGLHCEVCVRGNVDEALVTDAGSTNGTFIDGVRVAGTAPLQPNALLQIGQQVLRHEFRPPREAERSDELDRDLARASRYIRSLLPAPLREGPVRTDWMFEPCAQLGGDAFGCFALDDTRFAAYLIDVSGHGIAAAVHTVAVLNLIRQRALPGVDFADPTQVLTRLNEMFQMDAHGGLFFTFWYGVHDRGARRLCYASAGHHAAYLVDPQRRRLQPLKTRNPIVGALADVRFCAAAVDVAPGSMLHVFSDGVFEIETLDGRTGSLADFTPFLLEEPEPGVPEPARLHRRVQAAMRPGPLADDFSLLTVTFVS